jgi:hypothetical protein
LNHGWLENRNKLTGKHGAAILAITLVMSNVSAAPETTTYYNQIVASLVATHKPTRYVLTHFLFFCNGLAMTVQAKTQQFYDTPWHR